MNKLIPISACFKRMVNPYRIYHAVRMTRQQGPYSKISGNEQLKLYAQVLPSGYLHYGYFENPATEPEEISLADFEAAQQQYVDLMLSYILDTRSPILDVGCGMGGILRALIARGLNPVGLTPDRYQLDYLTDRYPNVELLQIPFEELDTDTYENTFGTVVMSQSLQYMNLHRVMQIIPKILKPGGRWIIADTFRLQESAHPSGHLWSTFNELLPKDSFLFHNRQDITRHVRPTLAFFYMWGERLGLPLSDYFITRFQRKHPGWHYVLQDIFSRVRSQMRSSLDVVSPATFLREKKYMLIVLTQRSR